MNQIYDILYFNGMPFLSAPVIDDRAPVPVVKEKWNLNKSDIKKGKATTMNELYNIPCCNGIPLFSAPVIDDRASLPKIKRKNEIWVKVFMCLFFYECPKFKFENVEKHIFSLKSHKS